MLHSRAIQACLTVLALLAVAGCAPPPISTSPLPFSADGWDAVDPGQAMESESLVSCGQGGRRHNVTNDPLARHLRNADYRAALALLGQQADAGNDNASQAIAAAGMSAICLKKLGFSLRAGQLLRRVGEMARQDPGAMDALAHRFAFDPTDEENFLREQDVYADCWDRFSGIRDLYFTGQHREAIKDVEDLRRAIVYDPLLSLWAGKIRMELGDLEGAARELAEAIRRFEKALRILDVQGQWRQSHVYDDELNESRLALGRCLFLTGRHTEARAQLSRVPEWSRFRDRARALIHKCRPSQSKP